MPVWSYSFGGEKQRGQEAQALIHDGVMFVTASYSRFVALDACTGKRLWTYEHRLPRTSVPAATWSTAARPFWRQGVFSARWTRASWPWIRDTGKVVWNEIRRPQDRATP